MSPSTHTHTHTHTLSLSLLSLSELLVLEREVVEASKEERGEGDTGQEEGQEVSCKMLPGEESEVRNIVCKHTQYNMCMLQVLVCVCVCVCIAYKLTGRKPSNNHNTASKCHTHTHTHTHTCMHTSHYSLHFSLIQWCLE